jgi:hypothetical protein
MDRSEIRGSIFGIAAFWPGTLLWQSESIYSSDTVKQ